MFRNYLITAFRSLSRNSLYALINISGLAFGIALFVLAQLITHNERNFDSFFPNADRIYAIYGIFTPEADVGVRSSIGVQSKVAPLVESDIEEVDVVARAFAREYLASYKDAKFYQNIRFVDPGFLDIFQFDYVIGDADTALKDPGGLIITESTAKKYFGNENPVGQTIRIKNKEDLHVTAVIKDIPANSHFSKSIIIEMPLQMLATTAALEKVSDFKLEGDWNNMSMSEVTYVLLNSGVSAEQVNSRLGQLYLDHVPERNRDYMAAFELRELTQLNLFPWEATGLPIMTSIDVLGLLILIIAIFNYTNLSTAQLLGRTREVGLRRVMGASRKQMFSQFLTESIALATLALGIALVCLALLIPVLNDLAGKNLSLGLMAEPIRVFWLVLLAVCTGTLAGSYPAWMISRGRTIGLLNGTLAQGRKSGFIRNAMLVAQFTIALFMMMCAGIIYTQNQMLQNSSDVFDRDRIVTLYRIDRDEITEKLDTLRTEFERLPGVERFALSSQVPFEQNQTTGLFGHTAAKAETLDIYRISIDEGFLEAYDISLLKGRNFSKEYTNDTLITDEEYNPVQDSVNTIVNELALEQLGFEFDSALDKTFYRYVTDGPTVEYRIIGIVADANFLGFHNSLKPIVFANRPDNQRIASLKLKGEGIDDTLHAIDRVWEQHVPAYPIERQFLDETFNDVYKIFRGINFALAGFAMMAVLVAIIGLFGMAAFMAERRTREIGIRKVLGAGILDIVRLLLLQFSRPVLIAIFIAAPLAWVTAGVYLNFFAERAAMPVGLFLEAGIALLLLAWLTVINHALRVARSNPILALRYE